MSESQERMMAVVEPGDVDAFLAICAKWDVDATVDRRGHRHRPPRRSTGTASASSTYPRARSRTTARPTSGRYARPDVAGRPPGRRRRGADRARRRATSCATTLLRLVASPNLCDKSWITDQYDRYVRGNTVLAQPDDSGMVRVDEETNLGVAVSTDCNGRFAKLDPYAGAQLALAESYRNVATGGARPLAITDCLNFGSPEDPDVMWQFAEACRGLKDACVELGIPVTGGNVSLYNQTGETAILPDAGGRGARRDRRRHPADAVGVPRRPASSVFLLGETREELSGSEWAHVVHGHLGGLPPAVDLAAERALARLLADAACDAVVTSAHDLSDGGLAQALAEACLRATGSGSRCRARGRRRPVRRPVRRVGRPRDRDRARPTPTASSRWPSATAYRSPRSAAPGATRSSVEGQFDVRSTSCARPGRHPARRPRLSACRERRRGSARRGLAAALALRRPPAGGAADEHRRPRPVSASTTATTRASTASCPCPTAIRAEWSW